jgi:Mrp family chromosome partitioning ATPase
MPHSESLKFKRTIIDNWTLPPDRRQAHLEPVSPSEAPVRLPSLGREVPFDPFEPVQPAATASKRGDTDPLVPRQTFEAPAPAQQHDAAPAPEPSAAPPNDATDGQPQNTLMRWTDTEAIVPLRRREQTEVHELVDLPADVDPRLVMLYAHASEQARAYRLLRHRLLALGDPRVIAVTSAEPGEGKTTCAANLGLALADETLARVLLIDANLRRPSLAQAFGFEPAESFIERLVVNRDVTPPYRVAAVRGTRLHIAALPQHRPRPGHIDRLLFSAALADLKSDYDYIVIDAASVFESADADVAGECADGVLLTARARASHRGAIESAIQQLHPTRVFGTVLLDS